MYYIGFHNLVLFPCVQYEGFVEHLSELILVPINKRGIKKYQLMVNLCQFGSQIFRITKKFANRMIKMSGEYAHTTIFEFTPLQRNKNHAGNSYYYIIS